MGQIIKMSKTYMKICTKTYTSMYRNKYKYVYKNIYGYSATSKMKLKHIKTLNPTKHS